MDAVRWNNLLRVRHAYESGSDLTGETPLEAFFEVAARCNLHCQMFAINYDSRYLPGSKRPPFLTPELFAKLEPLLPRLVRAYLFGLGEPLLNRHLLDYVRAVSSHGAEVWFNTNATLIDDGKAEELAVAGATAITVSIDGVTKETYERIRVGAKYEAVIRGIRSLVRAAKIHGRPRVDLSFVGMASNLHELPDLVDFAAEVGAGGVHVEPLYSQVQHDLQEHYARENLGLLGSARVDELFGEARDRAAANGVRLASRFLVDGGSADYVARAKDFRIWWTCNEPWTSIWVTSAGEVRTCCLNDTSFGNLFEQSFDEIWNGENFRAFRASHARGEGGPESCGNCVRNGRVRHSPFLAALEPVTYRPLRSKEEATQPALRQRSSEPTSGFEPAIERPRESEVVTDPLPVTGRVGHEGVSGEDSWDLVIDRGYRIPLASAAVSNAGRFTAILELPFLTEGAHLLSLRRRGDDTDVGLRTIHFWRPAIAAGQPSEREGEGEPERAAGSFAVRRPIFFRAAASSARIELDGKPCRSTWIYDEKPSRWGIAWVDLSDCPPGPHRVRVAPAGQVSTDHRIERLDSEGEGGFSASGERRSSGPGS